MWDTEDDLGGLIETDTGIRPELSPEFPGVLLEDDSLRPVTAVETKIIDPKTIITAAATNSGVIHTP